ncbi:MAG: prepilin-type N-terminal cleavage/methylation domain-containing protein [Planctomycetia bacterium]
MIAPAHHHRRGMTLIELLVVVVILALLSVTVLPNLSNTTDGRRFREAARGISSFIARAQARAINAPGPRGFMIQPLAADPRAGIDIFMADAPPPYGGQSASSRVVVLDPTSAGPTKRLKFIQTIGRPPMPAIDGATRDFIRTGPGFADGDSIQFAGLGHSFMLLMPATSPDTTPDLKISMWQEVGRNPSNTPWPRTPSAGVPFRILRQPRRASSGIYQAQRGAAIDLPYSCIGTQPLADPTLAARDRLVKDLSRPIVLLFDAAGRPQELVHSGGMRMRITEPLFLLIGSSELAGNPPVGGQPRGDQGGAERTGANWQHDDSVWLCIDNNTGVVKFGTVTPNASSLIGSQFDIRQTVGQGTAE